MTSTVKPLVEKKETTEPAMKAGSIPPEQERNITEERFQAEVKKRERENFAAAEEALKKAINSTPELAEMASALKVDMTREGMRIQIAEEKGKPLFASGSANLLPHTIELLDKVANVIQKLPNEISVRGHTDSVPFGSGATYTNWELSGDRANASRRELLRAGLPANRINNVVGKADTDHLLPDTPNDGRNRRISIILLHETVTTEDGVNKSTRASIREEKAKDELYERTEGKVEFP
jgi:chemotaxis protein MotB